MPACGHVRSAGVACAHMRGAALRVLTARAHRPEPRLVSALDLLLGVLELPPMVLISSALKELSLYQFWGTVAEQDPVSGLFHFPLTLTAVRPGSDAAAEGLRAGDQIVCWSSTNGGKFQDVDVLHDGNQLSARKFVDEATQNWLQAGGQCTVRVRLAPRCLQYPRCNGAIVECMDAFDFSRVCDECGMQQRSSMISSKADFNDCCRTAVPQAESIAVAETVVGRNAGVASATALQRAGKPGVGKENEEARKDLRLAQQRDKAREDISRYGEALQLSDTAKQEALRLFNLVADSNMVGGKVTRLTDGGKINTYKATVLASIHCASRLAGPPQPIGWILSVADVGAGETKHAVNKAVKIILEKAPIPAMEPRALIPVLCNRLGLPFSFEQQVCGQVYMIKEKLPKVAGNALLVASVSIVCLASMHRSSAATVGCEQDMCLRVSDVSGLAVSTLRGHVEKVLCGHEVRPGAISAVDVHLDQSIVTTGKRKTLG